VQRWLARSRVSRSFDEGGLALANYPGHRSERRGRLSTCWVAISRLCCRVPSRGRLTRAEIATRSDNLDVAWLRDDNGASEEALTDPDDIAAAIIGHLRAALAEIEAASEELVGEIAGSEEIRA
jgi:hypothetical protein